ncbi:MAG: diphthine--ammonia ligase [Candidatus Marsarchaeota archaeon]|nr:diphthine--ammonia ligase [Candidatus Marsarchaeota archaeon]
MIACLFSGGKDSTLALHKAASQGYRTELLITMRPENDASYMFHKPNIDSTALQAQAMEIDQVLVDTKGEKEKELADLEKAFADSKVDVLITGAVASNYQRRRIQAICDRLGIKHVAPLWGIEPMEELRELALHYDVIITHVAAEGLDGSFLGAHINDATIERLISANRRSGISLIFEGGEAESFVLDAPMFRKRIAITKSHVEMHGSTGTYVIDEASLVGK